MLADKDDFFRMNIFKLSHENLQADFSVFVWLFHFSSYSLHFSLTPGSPQRSLRIWVSSLAIMAQQADLKSAIDHSEISK